MNFTQKQQFAKLYAIFSFFLADPEAFIFESKEDALIAVKANKESRFKSFKNHNEALKFVKIGIQAQQSNTSSKQEPSNYDFLKCK